MNRLCWMILQLLVLKLFCEKPLLVDGAPDHPDSGDIDDITVRFSGSGSGYLDQCSLENYDCSADATCLDTKSGFQCVCNTGYTGNGSNCSLIDPTRDESEYSGSGDLDECKLKTHNCSENATCKDSENGFKCFCNDGYNGDGVICDFVEYKCDTMDCNETVSSQTFSSLKLDIQWNKSKTALGYIYKFQIKDVLLNKTMDTSVNIFLNQTDIDFEITESIDRTPEIVSCKSIIHNGYIIVDHIIMRKDNTVKAVTKVIYNLKSKKLKFTFLDFAL